ncbi:MAG: MBL fold metallo-hydrolase [Roseburia sp.]|nr:MBL fold metallo-hydrolase [Roseburia sp.]
MKIIRTFGYRSIAVVAAIITAFLAVLVAFFVPTPEYAAAEGGSLSVHFVNVGQGDCCIIELPDGKTAIIDGAENKKTHEQQIQTFIDNNLAGLKYFDYAILTHPDSDHCGSLDYVLEKYPSRVCYRPNVEAVGTKSNPYTDPGKADLTADAVTKNTAAYADAVKAMYATTPDFTSKVYVTDPSVAEQTIIGGSGDDRYVLNFYTPLSSKYSDWNEYSPITVLEYRGFKFAISGDAEKNNEKEFCAKVAAAATDGKQDKYDVFDDEFCVNVFKAGHHGSSTSSSQGYLDVMTTADGAKDAYYVFSCDPVGNTYGHPHQEVLDRLSAMGVPDANMLRTDKLGDLNFTVKFDGTQYSLYYGDEKTDAVAGCTLIVDDGAQSVGGDNAGDNAGDNVGGGGGGAENSARQDEPEQEDFFEKYKVYIIIAVVVIVIVVVVFMIYNSKNGKKRGKRKSGGGRGKNKR